jgi:hypothetical protein
MDQKEFNHRSEMIRQQLSNDELLSEVNQEVFSDELYELKDSLLMVFKLI